MAEWYIRGSSSSHQLITLDSDSFPPLLIRFCDGHADDHVEGCVNEDGDGYDQDQDQDQCKDQNQDQMIYPVNFQLSEGSCSRFCSVWCWLALL